METERERPALLRGDEVDKNDYLCGSLVRLKESDLPVY